MLASPSDVAQERLIVRDALNEWNATYSERSQLVLLPVAWETHASPSMEAPAQDVIDYQVLEGCDLLVGVFWTRLGTPTGRAPSGTVSEIEDHLQSGKPAMLYFSDTPVEPSSVDQAQYRALQDFKQSCIKRGLIETFSSRDEFRGKLARQLAQTVMQRFWQSPASGPAPTQDPRDHRVTLSAEAATLLVEAAKDRRGSLMRLRYMGGSRVQTNGKSWPEQSSAKDEALWWSAVDDLYSLGLIRDVGYKGEVFELTREGWDAAEQAAEQTE